MTTATAPKITKPMTFRRWYQGDCFAPSETLRWHTDGRLMVHEDALRTNRARALVSKVKPRPGVNRQRNMPDGNAKAGDIIKSASPETWTSIPRHVGTFHAAGQERWVGDIKVSTLDETDYAVVECDGAGSAPYFYAPCAVEWMLANVKWSALRVDPKRGGLWLVDIDGRPLALLMPISVGGEEGERLEEAAKLWAKGMP